MRKNQRGFFLNPFSSDVSQNDPYFANVSLLLKFDGANGSTSFVDSSPSPKTITTLGDGRVATSAARFGTGGLTSVSGGLSVSHTAADFGNQDFTLEFWLRPNSLATNTAIMGCYGTPTSGDWTNLSLYMGLQADGSITFFCYSGLQKAFSVAAQGLVVGVSTHIAVTRSYGLLQLFVGGVAQVSGRINSLVDPSGVYSINVGVVPLCFGTYTTSIGAPSNTSFDEIRITKGVCRYLVDFTPPTKAFPSS